MGGPWAADALPVRRRLRAVGLAAAIAAGTVTVTPPALAAGGRAAAGAPAAAPASTTSTTVPPEDLGAPPGVVLAPAGADEAGRQQAQAELRAVERDLKTATGRQR